MFRPATLTSLVAAVVSVLTLASLGDGGGARVLFLDGRSDLDVRCSPSIWSYFGEHVIHGIFLRIRILLCTLMIS